MQDLRYAFRVLRNAPGFTAVAVLTLALGIGLNATIFSLFDALALRPLELPGKQPLVAAYQDIRGVDRSMHGGRSFFSYSEYETYSGGNQVFSGLAAYMPEVSAMLGADVTPLHGQLTSCNYFTVLSAPIAIGRAFMPSECAADDAGPVVILSDEFWRTKFNADPAILGSTIKLNRIAFIVIGVAAPGFHGTELVRPAFWAPLSMEWAVFGREGKKSYLHMPDMSWLAVIGRLKSGVTLDEARANMSIIARRIDQTQPKRVTTLSLGPVNLVGDPQKHRIALAVGSVFLVAVGLVLLIACANIANLFLARAAARQREIAVRLAIGASRARLVRQLLTESALIAVSGGVLGTLVALWSAAAIARFLGANPTDTPLVLSVHPDPRIFAYALLLVGVTTIGFGLVPALQATRPSLTSALKAGDADGMGRGRLRHWLVGLQVAMCMVLLITAGLFLRGLNRAETVDPGWQMDGAATVTFQLSREGYTADRAAAFIRDLDARLRALPGVDVVAEATTTPLGGSRHMTPFQTPSMSNGVVVDIARVSPAYLAAIGLPIVRGHEFTRGAESAVIVNESAARRFWPDQDPLGKTIKGFNNGTYRVVGVTRDAELSELGHAHAPFLLLAVTNADALDMTSAIVRSKLPYSSLSPALRAAALSIDPELHVRVAPLRDNLRPYVQATQVLGGLSALLGVLGLVLASLGIYGTVAFTVARRTREIGIRVALGAQSAQVTRLIVRQAMRPVSIGAAGGTALCAAVSSLFAPVLFGVNTHDAAAFLGVPAFLLLVAAAASYAPARKALRVDALEALRAE